MCYVISYNISSLNYRPLHSTRIQYLVPVFLILNAIGRAEKVQIIIHMSSALTNRGLKLIFYDTKQALFYHIILYPCKYCYSAKREMSTTTMYMC